MTYYDRIVNMSIEELAKILADFCRNAEDCRICPFYADCPVDDGGSFFNWLTKEMKHHD